MNDGPDPLRVDPSGLADDLTAWRALNWAIETINGNERKVPKQPSNPEWNARSNDASTWGSFDDAINNALNDDGLGLGFPCAQPGHPYVFLDVDIPEAGEWVPSFDLLGGAIVERSPSGDSRRVILSGCEVPDWWTNQAEKTDDGETREVKVFTDSGYVTLTGDTVGEFDAPLKPTNSPALEQWLKEAWLTFNDADPKPWEDVGSPRLNPGGSIPETGVWNDVEWVDAETALDALEHIDPDLPNDEWVQIGFALGGHFPTETAERLFETWSRSGNKWDAEAERRVSSIIGDADGTVSIGTLIHHAKQGGGDASTAARAATVPNDETATANTRVSGETTVSDDDDSSLPDPSPHGFARHNGGYGYWSQDTDESAEWNEWTNFEIKVVSFLSLNDGSEEIELTIYPRHAEEYTVKAEPRAFNEKRTFKNEVACGRTTTFTGGEMALAKIKQFIGTQAAPELQGVRHMGRHSNEIVLPAGTLTADGWDNEPSRRYIERSLGIERKVTLSPENEGGTEEDVRETVRGILKLLPQTRDIERFVPVIGWFYVAPLRPIITTITGEFPVLSITGGTGAGKTSTLETMWELLGVAGDPAV